MGKVIRTRHEWSVEVGKIMCVARVPWRTPRHDCNDGIRRRGAQAGVCGQTGRGTDDTQAGHTSKVCKRAEACGGVCIAGRARGTGEGIVGRARRQGTWATTSMLDSCTGESRQGIDYAGRARLGIGTRSGLASSAM